MRILHVPVSRGTGEAQQQQPGPYRGPSLEASCLARNGRFTCNTPLARTQCPTAPQSPRAGSAATLLAVRIGPTGDVRSNDAGTAPSVEPPAGHVHPRPVEWVIADDRAISDWAYLRRAPARSGQSEAWTLEVQSETRFNPGTGPGC